MHQHCTGPLFGEASSEFVDCLLVLCNDCQSGLGFCRWWPGAVGRWDWNRLADPLKTLSSEGDVVPLEERRSSCRTPTSSAPPLLCSWGRSTVGPGGGVDATHTGVDQQPGRFLRCVPRRQDGGTGGRRRRQRCREAGATSTRTSLAEKSGAAGAAGLGGAAVGWGIAVECNTLRGVRLARR